MEPKQTLLHWIAERENVREKKEDNEPKPWTEDQILQQYKFCNVRREDDRVTRWIFDNWLYVYADHPNVSFAMCLARHFNWPDTLEAITDKVFGKWDPEGAKAVLKQRRSEGKKIYTGAYTVSTCGRSMDKLDYSFDIVLKPLFDTMQPPDEFDSCESYWHFLQTFEGFSSFMAGQVVADLKHIKPLLNANDWYDWAPLGPGSIRGLNRYFGRPLAYSVKQAQGIEELREIQSIIASELGMDLPLHNVQNCMCEFDKYVRLRYDGGKVRSRYPGS